MIEFLLMLTCHKTLSLAVRILSTHMPLHSMPNSIESRKILGIGDDYHVSQSNIFMDIIVILCENTKAFTRGLLPEEEGYPCK